MACFLLLCPWQCAVQLLTSFLASSFLEVEVILWTLRFPVCELCVHCKTLLWVSKKLNYFKVEVTEFALRIFFVCCFNIRKFSMCFASAAGTLNVNVKKEISSPAQHCSFEEAIKGTKLILIIVVNNLTINSHPNFAGMNQPSWEAMYALIKSGSILTVGFDF